MGIRCWICCCFLVFCEGTNRSEMELIILTKEGYFRRAREYCREVKRNRLAWQRVEDEYREVAEELGLERDYRYSSYESFRANLCRYEKG